MPSELLEYRTEEEKLGEVHLFYTQEMRKKFKLYNKTNLEWFVHEYILPNFLEADEEYKELIELYLNLNNLSGIAILSAHGYSEDGSWFYSINDEESRLVQDWINEMDGKYGVLIIHCCNPSSHEISSKRSAVLVYNYIYSEVRQLIMNEGNLELYIPRIGIQRIGYVDRYTIEWQIEQLKRELRKKKLKQS